MTLAQPVSTLMGVTAPRMAPPTPVESLIDDWKQAAEELGIVPMPWQNVAARYINARAGAKWLYPEICLTVARQNGKTEILKPHILQRLRMGRRILHTAQNRSLPRETFLEIASDLAGTDFVKEIRQANGQETIKTVNGGRYTLVAPRPGVRGHAVDDVILDEVREQHSFELIAAIKPTQTASRDRQTIYLSNAGDADSVVLNDLRRRAEKGDTRLAYLEWSAGPDRKLDDRQGWAEANPALGITIDEDTLADFHASLPSEVFETEHLCRWVISMQPRLIPDHVWVRQHMALEEPLRPAMGINMDPSGARASAVIAWQQSDGTIGCQVVADVTGEPLDVDQFGHDLREKAVRMGVTTVSFASWTDTDLARYFKNAKPMDGKEYANASETFARVVESGRLRWDGADTIRDDLAWTARKPHESGAWQAVKANEEHPITSALAAIRAVYIASNPRAAAPRIL